MYMNAVPVVLALAGLLAVQPSSPATPDELAARIQARYDDIRDFQADFVQSYEGGVLRTTTTERGTVAIKRPGKMRWVYTRPEQKEFVSDGVRMYAYVPADKQVIVSPAPDAATTPALFLAGKADLARDYTPSFTELPGPAPGLIGLKLVPRRADPEYDWLVLGVDARTLQIRQLVAMDRQGGRSTFTFTNLQENKGLADKTFEFRIPRGVDVITNGSPAK
ncbi:MAG: outer membrane lipoprotein chaperone LolA [Vicinamibacterales bacterium]